MIKVHIFIRLLACLFLGAIYFGTTHLTKELFGDYFIINVIYSFLLAKIAYVVPNNYVKITQYDLDIYHIVIDCIYSIYFKLKYKVKVNFIYLESRIHIININGMLYGIWDRSGDNTSVLMPMDENFVYTNGSDIIIHKHNVSAEYLVKTLMISVCPAKAILQELQKK